MRVLIVGAGLFGATMARELTDAGHRVTVVERRDHVGGQVHTTFNAEVGCHVHDHGPHIFRTSNETIWKFVNRFAKFNRFVNRPKVLHQGKLFSFPINLMTLYQVFGCTTPEEARWRVEADCADIAVPANMEEWCLKHMGMTLYFIFIEGYTTKQWGRHPTKLPASLLTRLPIRFTFDDNYYKGNPHQGIPVDGYTAMVEAMLDGIEVMTGVDFKAGFRPASDRVVYSGAIDEFFDYELGVLDYRSMRFDTKVLPVEDYQGNAVINYTERDVPYTRVVEHKHFDLIEGGGKTVVTWEHPETWSEGKDKTYPLRTAASQKLYEDYVALAAQLWPNMTFGGRLGTYAYLDMDQVITSAIAGARTLCKEAR